MPGVLKVAYMVAEYQSHSFIKQMAIFHFFFLKCLYDLNLKKDSLGMALTMGSRLAVAFGAATSDNFADFRPAWNRDQPARNQGLPDIKVALLEIETALPFVF